MTAAALLDSLLGSTEVPASADEIERLADLRTACAERDAAQRRVDDLLRQIRDLQLTRRRQLTRED